MNDKKEILLINRDKDFLSQTAELLGQAGYTVRTDSEMRGALSTLSAHPVGLIICDKELQDVSGYDFLNFIKKDPLREAIPFIFFVPVDDQGRASKAFELGATDFLVYPMDGQNFVRRINEILPLGAPEKVQELPEPSATLGQDLQSSQAVSMPPSERRQDERTSPLPSLEIEVSRDGTLWMPGSLKNFDQQGILMETSLFAKTGVSLMVRFKMPDGNFIVRGKIKHVSLDDFQSPADIGLEIEQDMVWEKIFADLGSLRGPALPEPEPVSTEIPVTPASTAEETVMLPPQTPKSPALYKTSLESSEGPKEPSYDARFYYSLVGKQLDNYRTITFIGCGSMGGVFQGWDVALEREVALKVISYELSSQETFRDMFIKEARVVSRLDHPNIAQIYYIGNSDDILYYAMEFIEGDTLADLIRRNETLSPVKGIDYLTTICKTLDFVSKKNIIHRDIKPENIMVNFKGVVKIVDFGVAKINDSTNPRKQPEAIMGSPLYMSPDCITGKPLDLRSDIYSLGATFYHALTGHPPFEGDGIQDILDQHQNRPLTSLKEKNPKVPNVLGKIIEKMMAKDPKDRYQDYKSIIQAFKSLRFRALSRIQNRS